MARKLLTILTVLLLIAGATSPAVAQGTGKNDAKAAAESCKDNGWKDYTDTDGNAFKNQGQCVKYARQGGELVEIVKTSLKIVDGTDPWNGYLEGTGFTPRAKLAKVTFASDRATLNLTTPVGTLINDDGTFKTKRIIYWCSEFEGHNQTTGMVTVEDSTGLRYSQEFDMADHCAPAG